MTQEESETRAAQIHRHLADGWITAWLVAGPLALEGNQDAPDFAGQKPTEGELVFVAQAQAKRSSPPAWQVMETEADHLVHLDTAYAVATPGSDVVAWLVTLVHMAVGGPGTLRLVCNRAVELWVNGARVEVSDPGQVGDSSDIEMRETAVEWVAGENEIRLYTRCPAGDGSWLVGTEIAPADADTEILLPTTYLPVERRENLASMMAEAYLTQDVYQGKERLYVHWPHNTQRFENLAVRLQAPNRRIYAEASIEAQAGAKIPLVWPDRVADGRYDVVLMARPQEYYEKQMRVVRRIPVQIVQNQASTAYYGEWEERARAALEDAGARKGLFAQIARLRLEQWSRLDSRALEDALALIIRRGPGWRLHLLGLLGMVLRFGDAAEFPVEWGTATRERARAFLDGPEAETSRADEEIVQAAAVVLAGLLLGDGSAVGRGGTNALAWLARVAQRGLDLWDSPAAYARVVAALSHLVDLGEDEELVEMAAVTLDKLLLGLGTNSFQGVFGSAHAETTAAAILGNGAEPTAPIGRIAWGKGSFNAHLAGAVSLACAGSYVLPEIIAATAVDVVSTTLQQERHATMEGEVHKLTYRSPAGMLSAALDYRAGEPGRGEHIWQATLGPGVVVFVNHPAIGADLLDEAGIERIDADTYGAGAGFWRGNYRLPRVGQVDDLLLAWYRVGGNERLGFTHAYFPRARFDEYRIAEQWAFGRRGDGFVALYCSGHLESTLRGPGAQRELRGVVVPNRTDGGHDVLWVCRVGSAETDGTFGDFCAAVESAQIRIEKSVAHVQNLWGRDVTFGWKGPLMAGRRGVAGDAAVQTEQPLRFTDHYAGEFAHAPFPADAMEVNYKGHAMRLELGGVQSEAV